MIVALIVCGLYLLVVFPVGLLFGRLMRTGGVTVAEYRKEPDWLWSQPTDCLSDAAVDARFAEIVAHFKVRQ